MAKGRAGSVVCELLRSQHQADNLEAIAQIDTACAVNSTVATNNQTVLGKVGAVDLLVAVLARTASRRVQEGATGALTALCHGHSKNCRILGTNPNFAMVTQILLSHGDTQPAGLTLLLTVSRLFPLARPIFDVSRLLPSLVVGVSQRDSVCERVCLCLLSLSQSRTNRQVLAQSDVLLAEIWSICMSALDSSPDKLNLKRLPHLVILAGITLACVLGDAPEERSIIHTHDRMYALVRILSHLIGHTLDGIQSRVPDEALTLCCAQLACSKVGVQSLTVVGIVPLLSAWISSSPSALPDPFLLDCLWRLSFEADFPAKVAKDTTFTHTLGHLVRSDEASIAIPSLAILWNSGTRNRHHDYPSVFFTSGGKHSSSLPRMATLLLVLSGADIGWASGLEGYLSRLAAQFHIVRWIPGSRPPISPSSASVVMCLLTPNFKDDCHARMFLEYLKFRGQAFVFVRSSTFEVSGWLLGFVSAHKAPTTAVTLGDRPGNVSIKDWSRLGCQILDSLQQVPAHKSKTQAHSTLQSDGIMNRLSFLSLASGRTHYQSSSTSSSLSSVESFPHESNSPLSLQPTQSPPVPALPAHLRPRSSFGENSPSLSHHNTSGNDVSNFAPQSSPRPPRPSISPEIRETLDWLQSIGFQRYCDVFRRGAVAAGDLDSMYAHSVQNFEEFAARMSSLYQMSKKDIISFQHQLETRAVECEYVLL